MVIDAFEGQLITLVVVISFILVFLIREWVVQQQPILMRGPNADAQVAIIRNAEALAQRQNGEDGPQRPDGEAIEEPDNEGEAGEPRARIIARARLRRPRAPRRVSEPQDSQDDGNATPEEVGNQGMNDQTMSLQPLKSSASDSFVDSTPEASLQRPNADRDTLATAAEIRRTLEEGSHDSSDNVTSMATFNDLWDRAAKRPLDVIKIIEDQGRTEELGWIVAAMEKIEGYRAAAELARKKASERSSKNSADSHAKEPSSDPIPVTQEEVPQADSSQHQNSITAPSTDAEAPANVIDSLTSPESQEPQDLEHGPQYQASAQSYHTTTSNEEPAEQAGTEDPIQPTDQPTMQPDNAAVQAPAADRRRRLLESVTEWLWGGVAPVPTAPEQPTGDEERIVGNIADEAPFVPVDHGQPLRLAANDRAVANQDPEVVAAAIQAGVDPNQAEAADEIEDLEGILELIGMQGPLAGLVQNGMFCACLVSLTILVGIWIPYVVGKMFLILLAHPTSILFRIPIRWATSTADVVIDAFTFIFGCAIYWTDTLFDYLWMPVTWMFPALGTLSQNRILAEIAKTYAESALGRLANSFVATGDVLSESDFPMLSILAHESLRSMKSGVASTLQFAHDCILAVFETVSNSYGLVDFFKITVNHAFHNIQVLKHFLVANVPQARARLSAIAHSNPLHVKLTLPQRTTPIDYGLVHWNFKDRAFAVLFGYLFFALLGVAYLRVHSWMKDNNRAGRVAGGVADALYQAGGVMKVVLIISIEMLAFPLYCGLLLDVALLPLFGGATMMTRFNFTYSNPMTSLFIHWFVGTCYMFHFALFVSMCRKILRTGVLCKSNSCHYKS